MKLYALVVVALATVLAVTGVADTNVAESDSTILDNLDLVELSKLYMVNRVHPPEKRCETFEKKLRTMLNATELAVHSTRTELFDKVRQVLSERQRPFNNKQLFLGALESCIQDASFSGSVNDKDTDRSVPLMGAGDAKNVFSNIQNALKRVKNNDHKGFGQDIYMHGDSDKDGGHNSDASHHDELPPNQAFHDEHHHEHDEVSQSDDGKFARSKSTMSHSSTSSDNMRDMMNQFIRDEIFNEPVNREQDPVRKLELLLDNEKKLTNWLHKQLEDGKYEVAELRSKLNELEDSFKNTEEPVGVTLEKARTDEMRRLYEEAAAREQEKTRQLNAALERVAKLEAKKHKDKDGDDDDDDDGDGDDDDDKNDHFNKRGPNDPVAFAGKLQEKMHKDDIATKCQKYYMLYNYPDKLKKKVVKTIAKLRLPAGSMPNNAYYLNELEVFAHMLRQSNNKGAKLAASELARCGNPHHHEFGDPHHHQFGDPHHHQWDQIPVHYANRINNKPAVSKAWAYASSSSSGANMKAPRIPPIPPIPSMPSSPMMSHPYMGNTIGRYEFDY